MMTATTCVLIRPVCLERINTGSGIATMFRETSYTSNIGFGSSQVNGIVCHTGSQFDNSAGLSIVKSCLQLCGICDLNKRCVLVIQLIKAIFLVGVLGGKNLNIECTAEIHTLILITGSFLHFQSNTKVCGFTCNKIAIGGFADGVYKFSDGTNLLPSVKIETVFGISGNGRIDININNISKCGQLTCRNKLSNPLESKSSLVGNTKNLDIGITGFPILIIKNGFFGILNGSPGAVFLKQFKVNLQGTGLNFVTRGSHRICEPSERTTNEHRYAHQKRERTKQESTLGAFLFSHYYDLLFIFVGAM